MNRGGPSQELSDMGGSGQERESMRVDGDVLVVTVGGVRPTSDVEALGEIAARWMRIADECSTRRLRKVLYTSTAVGNGSSRVNKNVFAGFGRFGFDKGVRLAIVRPDSRTRRVMELGIKVARTEGWDLDIFETAQEATAWLNRSSL